MCFNQHFTLLCIWLCFPCVYIWRSRLKRTSVTQGLIPAPNKNKYASKSGTSTRRGLGISKSTHLHLLATISLLGGSTCNSCSCDTREKGGLFATVKVTITHKQTHYICIFMPVCTWFCTCFDIMLLAVIIFMVFLIFMLQFSFVQVFGIIIY